MCRKFKIFSKLFLFCLKTEKYLGISGMVIMASRGNKTISGVIQHTYLDCHHNAFKMACRVLVDGVIYIGSCWRNRINTGDTVRFKCYIAGSDGEVVFFRRMEVIHDD